MKIKSVPAVCAAFAALCATMAFASAETAPAELSANDLLTAPAVAADDNARDVAAVSGEKSSQTGVEGVAAVAGVIALAGAAVVISRKKA